MQRINLYQEEFRPRSDPTDAAHLAVWLLLAIVVLAVVSAGLAWRAQVAEQELAAAESRREAAEARLTALQRQLEAAREQQEEPHARVRQLRAELAAKNRLLQYLESGPLAERRGFSPLLDGLARRIVDGVWLRRIELTRGGVGLRLEGSATEPGQVPELMAALGEAEAFRGRSFRTLEMMRPAEADWRLDFVLASEPAKSAANRRAGTR